jgi:hypothetical protein
VGEPVTPNEANRRAAAFRELLQEIARSTGDPSEWWNFSRYEQLGNRTPTEAWLAGDHEAVENLIVEWHAASEAAVERQRNDPEFMDMIREKSTALRIA